MGIFDGGGDDSGKKARKELRKSRKYFGKKKLDLPTEEELMAQLESPELVGLLDTEQLSDYDRIEGDPRLRDAQMEALESMRERGELGLTAQDRAERRELQREDAGRSQAQLKGIEQQMAQQGMGSSGASLMAKLQAQENASARAAQQSDKLIGDVEGGRRQALQQAGAMAGTMGAEDFRQDMSQEQARRSIEQFNLGTRQNIAAQNLAARQRSEEMRADVANQQSLQNIQAKQQAYQNRFGRAQAKAGIQSQVGQAYGMDPKTPSPFETAMKVGATGASIYADAQTGGAMSAIKAAVEDGGVIGYADGGISGEDVVQAKLAENREKVRATTGFDESKLGGGKEKLMKLLMENREKLKARYEGGGVVQAEDGMSFNDAFRSERDKQGRGGEFSWEGNQYNTNLAGETGEGFSIGEDKTSQDKFNEQADKAAQIRAEKEAIEEKQLSGIRAEELLKSQDGGNKNLSKGLAELGDLFSPQQESQPVDLSYTPVDTKNVLDAQYRPVGMEDGGTYEEEDGSLEFLSDGNGDIVEGDSFERDRVDAKLNSGEMVLNAAQQQRLMDMIRGKEGTESIGEEDIVEGVPQDYQQGLMEESPKKNKKNKQSAGFKKLLEMLGE